MSVKPEDILATLNVEYAIIVDDLEKKIDKWLHKTFTGQAVSFSCEISRSVFIELQKRYSAWILTQNNHGNETMIKFTPKPININCNGMRLEKY